MIWLRKLYDAAKPHFFGIGAGICFGLALGLALFDKVGAATVVSGLFVVLILFHYLPQMESFKAYGIEAKWRERLNEANEIIDRLRKMARLSAEHTYHTLGWGGRYGDDQTARRKQRLADQVDDLLFELGIDKEEVNKLKRDYLTFLEYDLYQVFQYVLVTRAERVAKQISAHLNTIGESGNEHGIVLRSRQDTLARTRRMPNALSALATVGFRECCANPVKMSGLPTPDLVRLRTFSAEVEDIVEECLAQGKATEEALRLLESAETGVREKLYLRVFGEAAPELTWSDDSGER